MKKQNKKELRLRGWVIGVLMCPCMIAIMMLVATLDSIWTKEYCQMVVFNIGMLIICGFPIVKWGHLDDIEED